MPKRVVVYTPGTSFTRSSTAERPNRSIVSSLMTDTERGVSSSGLLKPNDDPLGAFGSTRFGSAVTSISSMLSAAPSVLTVAVSAASSACACATPENTDETTSVRTTNNQRVHSIRGVRICLARFAYACFSPCLCFARASFRARLRRQTSAPGRSPTRTADEIFSAIGERTSRHLDAQRWITRTWMRAP